VLNDEKENRSSTVVTKIEQRGNRFTIRYTHNGFNKMYIIDKRVGRTLGGDSNIRSTLFRLRRISSRNALTYALLKGIIKHQGDFLRTGNPINLVPFSQIQLTQWINTRQNIDEKSRRNPGSDFCHPCSVAKRFGLISEVCNTWVSRLVRGISVITPSGEEKPLKSFFQTQKDVNKRLIKQLLDKENQDLESGTLKKPLTDNQIKAVLESEYGVKRSRHSIAHCRKDMGIPPAKRRLSGYKYPPLSANFSLLYPLLIEEVPRNAPSSPGIYEFRLKGKEIEYPNGKTQVIYIGSTKNIKKRLREHLGKNSKNSHIKDFLTNSGCSFRFIQFSKRWKEEEGRLYNLFVTTYGAPPKCNRARPPL